MPLDDWDIGDPAERTHYRMRSTLGRVTLKLGHDDDSVQHWQTEGYVGEIRDKVQRLGHFGFSFMPLPGATGHVTWQGGYRAMGTITSVEDHRYRVKGLKGGEIHHYMVDGAKADGTGGTTRSILKGALGWLTTVYGKIVGIGDSNTTNVNLTVTVLFKVVGNQEITGNLVVDGTLTVKGATTVQDINIQGNETGGGSA
jgi:phage baseplate assembly protein V